MNNIQYIYNIFIWYYSSEYEAQSADLEKELQDALTSRKELESTNEGKFSGLLNKGWYLAKTAS